ncbi:MAG: phosphoribosylformylglycinamidine synthase subunit PurL [Bdellovibrionales bacterium]|nr:phosphoribosylformylglycinamidine synthase subunit PurL [Bdellovibrionales bacterium]
MDLQQKLKIYRISNEEYQKINEVLGRPPEGVEWALFSALWSEHCSYKSSKVHLKKFYSSNSRVLESFGENAGVIDLGEGERVAFKMESHNHPSFISPVQGAATGVGGILRDIFTMGARPVALANYLCFGSPKADRMSHLVDGVVEGISSYGNCVGVPMLTGQTEFNSSYNGNILVNALALGLFRPGEAVFTSKSAEPGQFVVYVGAKTGRDGVHGASMASESFEEGDESKKPTVQIGDPFFEKLLIESCLEVMKEGLVESIQDMGAAGLTSSAFEMASKAGVGFVMRLDEVPIRDQGITPEEILLSESQERMLLTCNPDNFPALKKVFEKWDLDAAVIGEVQPGKTVDLFWHGEKIASMDPDILVENAPLYQRPYDPWSPKYQKPSLAEITWSNENQEVVTRLKTLLSDIRGGGKNWVYEQYDQRVGGQTHWDCSQTVGILRLPDSQRGLGLVLGCRPYVMRLDAAQGGMDSVAYPALQLAIKGFEPLAITDCLNFGNPEKPELMTEFVAAVEAMSQMCESLDTPVISGNVSLYNETGDKNVTSTPSTGVVGLRKTIYEIPADHFTEPGDEVFLLTCSQLTFNGQMAECEGDALAGFGEIDPKELAQFTKAMTSLGSKEFVTATRVVGKFGLVGTLAKMSLQGMGVRVSLGDRVERYSSLSTACFGEVLYEVIVETPEPDLLLKEWSSMTKESWSIQRLGVVGGEDLEVEGIFRIKVSELQKCSTSSWEKHFETLA